MYQLDRQKQTITIEGETYTKETLATNFNISGDSFRNHLLLFLQEWFSDSPFLSVRTSGSTGTPKEIVVEKERMMQSARLTCSFLGLIQGDTALLCMSLDYIAGKMMVVRALVSGLDIYPVAPCSNPLQDLDIAFKFAAMIPMQVYGCLQSEKEKKRLSKIDSLIIGGGAIDRDMEISLKSFTNNIYSTYGMTETLSHIALRWLNGREATDCYIPFPSVCLSLAEDDTLIIDAPLVTDERLYTNDIARINEDGSFQILGRKDNVINSGGVKIQIEEVEELLKPVIDTPFAISSMPDPKFGEIVVLTSVAAVDKKLLSETLPPYFVPKKIILIEAIPLTETGKINRPKLKEMICEGYIQ